MNHGVTSLMLLSLLAWGDVQAEENYAIRREGEQLVLTNLAGGGGADSRRESPAAGPERPAASPAVPRQRPYSHLVNRVAGRYGVDQNLVHAVIQVESAYNPTAVSSRGAVGLMQLLPSTAAELGIHDLTDAHDNIVGGVRHLRRLLDRFSGNVSLALAAYNAGAGAVDRYKGIPPYKETREYVQRIRRIYRGNGRPAQSVVAAGTQTIYRYKDASGAEVFSQYPRSTPPDSTVGRRR